MRGPPGENILTSPHVLVGRRGRACPPLVEPRMPPFLQDRSRSREVDSWAMEVQGQHLGGGRPSLGCFPYESYYLFRMEPSANECGIRGGSKPQTKDWMVQGPECGRTMHLRTNTQANQPWERAGTTTGHTRTLISSLIPMRRPPYRHRIRPDSASFVIHTRMFLGNVETKYPRPWQDILPRIYQWS